MYGSGLRRTGFWYTRFVRIDVYSGLIRRLRGVLVMFSIELLENDFGSYRFLGGSDVWRIEECAENLVSYHGFRVLESYRCSTREEFEDMKAVLFVSYAGCAEYEYVYN